METTYDNIGFSNNFMFGKIMENPKRAKAFLEQILNIKIHHIQYIEREKQVDEKYDGRSIRMDIYAEDGKNIYNCEMQTTNTGNLPKRSRYYQGLIDIAHLKRNDNFRKLKRSFVIFICTFDPFDKKQYIYTFENVCKEMPELKLEDEAYKIFINTKGIEGNVSEDIKELLKFIDTSEDRTYNNPLANELLEDLKNARANKEWRKAYMTWEMYGKECRYEGMEAGKQQLIEKMLMKGKTPLEISELCDLSIEEVEVVVEKLAITVK